MSILKTICKSYSNTIYAMEQQRTTASVSSIPSFDCIYAASWYYLSPPDRGLYARKYSYIREGTFKAPRMESEGAAMRNKCTEGNENKELKSLPSLHLMSRHSSSACGPCGNIWMDAEPWDASGNTRGDNHGETQAG